MGKSWKKRRNTFDRKVGKKGPLKKRILIVCEGERTEPNYLRCFRVSSAVIEVVGEGYNTVSLVQRAIERRDKAKKDGIEFQEVWCVFDRDDFPVANFNNALTFARQEKIKVAYSNEAFEIWYLLHFDYIDAALSRQQYAQKLGQRLGFPYKKNSKDIYEELLNRQKDAIRNAEKLLQIYNPPNPIRNNPSTTVHLLVNELNSHN
jgi:hypothetical protein